MINAFEEEYLSLLKRFLFLSICRLYFIQVLREIDMEKVLQEFSWRLYHSNDTKIHQDAAPHYLRNKSLHQKFRLLTVQKQPPEVFCNKGVLRNFAKFAGKNLCQSLFFNNIAGLRPQTRHFIKKETLIVQLFLCKFCEISKNTYFREQLWTTASGLQFTLYV